MHVRSLTRLGSLTVVLGCASLALLLPACDCAGNTGPTTTDAGDTGPALDSGPPRDGGPDTGARDTGGSDTNADAGATSDAGGCSSPETCNGMDDDCDGMTDENIVVTCGTDIGICRSGTQTCTAGTLGACTGGMSAAPAEICGNGLDDDCNEMVDDGCTCTNGATQSCGSGVGECARGTQTCAASAWGACVGEVTPTAELCDGLDNNCDGVSDETFAGLGGACDGADVDMCREGTLACSADHLGTTCSDATGDSVEACNGVDDNCDGRTDEGCSCTDGTTQPCGTMVGACTTGTQTCASGAWGTCSGTGPSTEVCDGVDNNCDGSTDEGFPTLGMTCDGADADACAEGMFVCGGGGVVCNDTTGDSVEVCDAMDNNCDGATDEGFMVGVTCDGPDADMCSEGAFMCNASGGATCSDATGDSVETCNGMDDDCDGNIDEGNPGGGVACGPSAGTCVTQTACVAGAIVCRGTFVASAGTATGMGTQAMPLNSITAAITNAVTIGGGADVCVCDPVAGSPGPSVFTENVTMVEGVSVLGGFDCATWTASASATTTVADIDADGLTFPAGITTGTALDHMTVLGLADPTAGATTSAVTITDSSPTLSTDTVRAGSAATAIGLRVVHAAAAASPTIMGGTYSSSGVPNGTAIAVSLEGASPIFNAVTIGGGLSSGVVASPTSAYGVRCTDCAGSSFTNGSITPAGATTTAVGFQGSGNVLGLAMTGTTVNGGTTSANSSTSTGVSLVTCTGGSTFTNVGAFGGANAPATTPTMTVRTAFATSGAACAPLIDGGRYRGCEFGVTCIGVDASASSPLAVRNVNPGAGGLPYGIVGSTTADTTIGLRCQGGACARITTSTIDAGVLTRAPVLGAAVWLSGASPLIDSCRITGPSGGVIAPPQQQFYGMYLHDTTSTISNNVIHDGLCGLRVMDVLFDMTPNPAGPSAAPTVVNNTLDYRSANLAGARLGLVFFSNSAGTPAAGVFRNNFIHNLGATGTTTPVIEANVNSDPMTFENNALWDPTAAGGGLYVDEASMNLTTAAMINALPGAASNVVVDCMLNATFHLTAGSMCIDAGTNTTCPAADFEAQSRPFSATAPAFCDIGADELHP